MSNWNEEMKLHVDEIEEILAEFLPEQKGVYYQLYTGMFELE